MQHIKIWDLPTRLFHWLLVLLVAGLFITGSVGGNWMEWHMRLGYGVFVLLLFRLAWGVLGGHWSRFVNFVPTPKRLLAYLNGDPSVPPVGHNPLGALSVLAMLLILTLQVGTGLISDDEIAFTGPWIGWVSSATSGLATGYHKNYGKIIILSLVFIHVIAIIFYTFFKKKPLIKAMVHGQQQAAAPTTLPASADAVRERLLALVVMGLCSALVWWLVS
jgi:cytochrome b